MSFVSHSPMNSTERRRTYSDPLPFPKEGDARYPGALFVLLRFLGRPVPGLLVILAAAFIVWLIS